jgi:pimeloyl-ACP methyl ester carboxylesterase
MEGGTAMCEQPNIVLVHGAWADGSSWSTVIKALQADGYSVTAPQFPETALSDDVARLRQGESLGALLGGGPPTPSLAHLTVDGQGFGWLPEDDFVGHFAADVDSVQARVMHAVQQPISMSAFEDVMGEPAWKSQPSWYLVATNDEAIPPDAERQFASRMGATSVEVPLGSRGDGVPPR